MKQFYKKTFWRQLGNRNMAILDDIKELLSILLGVMLVF